MYFLVVQNETYAVFIITLMPATFISFQVGKLEHFMPNSKPFLTRNNSAIVLQRSKLKLYTSTADNIFNLCFMRSRFTSAVIVIAKQRSKNKMKSIPLFSPPDTTTSDNEGVPRATLTKAIAAN